MSMISHPDVVAQQIREPVSATASGKGEPAALAETGSRTAELAAAGAGAPVAAGTVLTTTVRRRAGSGR
ncbi:hypothetical protein [Streptomyces sp. NPDC096934]|uniref:hypothetical protein n=1 Tax=Streptomyces sp. NPDC096934 TaxID=3155551 RepID=UPI00332CC977